MKNKRAINVFFYLTIALFLADWLFIFSILYTDSNVGWWFSVVVSFFAFVSFFVFILISHDKKKNMLLGLIIFLPSIFLSRERALQALPFFFLALILYWVAVERRIKREQLCRINLEPYRLLRRGRTFIILAVALMIAVGFYFSMINNQKVVEAPRFEIQVPEFVGNLAVGIINFITPRQEINKSTTVDELILKSLEARASSQMTDNPLIEMIPPGTSAEEVVDNAVRQSRENLSEQLGVNLNGNETMGQLVSMVLSKWINETINSDVGDGKAVPFGAALALGLTLYALLWFISILQFWTAWGILAIMIKRGKVETEVKMREVERVA